MCVLAACDRPSGVGRTKSDISFLSRGRDTQIERRYAAVENLACHGVFFFFYFFLLSFSSFTLTRAAEGVEEEEEKNRGGNDWNLVIQERNKMLLYSSLFNSPTISPC